MPLTVTDVLTIRRERGARVHRMRSGTEIAAQRAIEQDAIHKTGEMLDAVMLHPNATLEIQREIEAKALDLLEHHVIPAIRRNVE